MQSQNQPESQPSSAHPAAEHVAGAHRLMQELREKVGEHPELTEAIRNLEMALSILTVKTAGFL
jgi:hypothetical protein